MTATQSHTCEEGVTTQCDACEAEAFGMINAEFDALYAQLAWQRAQRRAMEQLDPRDDGAPF